jgi:hypothetical protein
MPASFLTLDWQEKYSQQDTQSQNNCVCNRPTPVVSSSPQETLKELQYSLFMNCLRSCPREIQGSLVCHNCWCLGCTVCENIHSWISLVGDLVFSHQGEIYGFKFPKRFFGDLFQRSHSFFSLSILII